MTEDIAYFYTADEKVSAYTFDGRNFPMDRSLDTLMGQLSDTEFYRANRQFIISRKAVSDLSVWFGSRLQLNLCVKTPERIVFSKAVCPTSKSGLSGFDFSIGSVIGKKKKRTSNNLKQKSMKRLFVDC